MSTAQGERRQRLFESRKILQQVPGAEAFELPGKPHVVYQVRDYSKDKAEGAQAARADVPFLFKAFETGQLNPKRLAKLSGGAPRQSTIHEYLDWTVTAEEGRSDDELVGGPAGCVCCRSARTIRGGSGHRSGTGQLRCRLCRLAGRPLRQGGVPAPWPGVHQGRRAVGRRSLAWAAAQWAQPNLCAAAAPVPCAGRPASAACSRGRQLSAPPPLPLLTGLCRLPSGGTAAQGGPQLASAWRGPRGQGGPPPSWHGLPPFACLLLPACWRPLLQEACDQPPPPAPNCQHTALAQATRPLPPKAPHTHLADPSQPGTLGLGAPKPPLPPLRIKGGSNPLAGWCKPV
jgi:hypothetical protein